MTAYEFCADWVARNASPDAKVLDYGCGAGQIVGLLRRRGMDAFGCDVFYDGGDSSKDIPTDLGSRIKSMTADRIPFEDARFDVVLSNVVFEHVPDMETALQEIARVLKPGGYALNVFPDRSVWREGHCAIPFLHWFPKGTTPRIYYATCLRALGLGHFDKTLTLMHGVRSVCDWLDRWTYYRSLTEIHERFNRVIGKTIHAEEQWLSARFNGRCDRIPVMLQRLIVRKMAGVTLVSVKAAKFEP